MSGSPPAALRRLLERALPAEVREGIVGDLDEVYRARRAQSGPARVGLWYLGQVASISVRFAVERISDALPLGGASIGLDLKLGLRMLVKYPMLTLVAGLAITAATAIGVGGSEFVRDLVTPRVPLEDGDRVVRLYEVDTEAGGEARASLYDLALWRASVSSLEDVGGYETMEQGLVSDRGEAGTVSLASISASAFHLTRIPPYLGRFLSEADERADAPPVVVLGYSVWQTLLDGDPDPIGRTVQLAGTLTTVVGVMPEGYGFPARQNAWVPLRVDPAAVTPESAPRADIFARLAPGATLGSAQAELDAVGRRAAADFPDVYARRSPGVAGFARASGPGPLLVVSCRCSSAPPWRTAVGFEPTAPSSPEGARIDHPHQPLPVHGHRYRAARISWVGPRGRRGAVGSGVDARTAGSERHNVPAGSQDPPIPGAGASGAKCEYRPGSRRGEGACPRDGACQCDDEPRDERDCAASAAVALRAARLTPRAPRDPDGVVWAATAHRMRQLG